MSRRSSTRDRISVQDELVCTVGAALVDPGRPPGSCKRSRTRVAIDRLPIETAETAKAHRG